MRRYLGFAQILLILSIINFARAAPVIAQGPHGANLEFSADNPPSQEFAWPSQLQANDPRPPSPEFSWPSHLQANNPRPPSPEFSWPSQLQAKKPRPTSPDVSWPSQLPANNRPPSPAYSWPNELQADNTLPPNRGSSPPYQSADHPLSSSDSPHPTEPETKDLLSQLLVNPPRYPPSPAVPETKDFLSKLGSGPSNPAESAPPKTMDFLDLLLKGRVKRGMSGSGAVNSAQESQAPIDLGRTSLLLLRLPHLPIFKPSQDPRIFLIEPATSTTGDLIRCGQTTPETERFGVA